MSRCYSALNRSDWLERIYFSSQRIEQKSEQASRDALGLTSLVPGNTGLLWFWATWESAQFCTLGKLRTPLGKANDTFLTLEAALKEHAQEIRDEREKAKRVRLKKEKKKRPSGDSSQCCAKPDMYTYIRVL